MVDAAPILSKELDPERLLLEWRDPMLAHVPFVLVCSPGRRAPSPDAGDCRAVGCRSDHAIHPDQSLKDVCRATPGIRFFDSAIRMPREASTLSRMHGRVVGERPPAELRATEILKRLLQLRAREIGSSTRLNASPVSDTRMPSSA